EGRETTAMSETALRNSSQQCPLSMLSFALAVLPMGSYRVLLSIAVLSLLHRATSREFPVIKISYGSLRGYSFTAEDGTEALIFKKIPFASPPIGDLRWRKPQPPKPWNYTIDGTFFGPACAQRTIMYKAPVVGMSEDCLHLNVYTSRKCIESNASCPVLFIIHGGTGIFESTMKFPDETLARNFVSRDILVVTAAYRLGAFGAMSIGDENELPANLAMHDLIAALKFTRNEIRHFGGDNERITIMGHSSGGEYALMLAFSPGISKPGEKRLFSGVISMSGPSFLESQEETVQRSHAVIKELGCEGSPREIMACLRLIDTETILETAFRVHGIDVVLGKGPYGITMAGELFPIRNQRELRENKDPVRLMIGTIINELNNGTSGDDKANRVVGIVNDEECYEKYTKDVETGQFDPGYNQASQDIVLTAHLFAKCQAEIGGEAYLYEYDYPVHGAHTDDAYFVLGFHEFDMDENEKWMSRAYPRYFSNFIRGERLAHDWSPVKPHLMNYYSVNRSIEEDIFPHTKYGHQNNLAQYYDDLVKYDNLIVTMKKKVLSAPVEYKSLNFEGDFQDFLESLTMLDAVIFFCFLVGAVCVFCCICTCLRRIFCCCC
ncbi:hypothetical protein PMAYCL1PPCAC_33161, partial [Pristionchus mayeri]